MHTNPVAAALASISLGPSVVVHNLTMIPLLRRDLGGVGAPGTHSTSAISTSGTLGAFGTDSGVGYSLLDDALGAGSVEITEVSEQGSVPELKFLNRGGDPVLIVDGEELVGAKQNRIVNLSILAGAKTDLTIPVSCVEAGRWRARSRAFTAAPRTQYASGRAKRMADVSFAMHATGRRVSDQAGVWQDIAEKSARLEAPSPTSAMEAIFERHGASIDEYVAGCRPVDGQVGALFVVGDRVIGLDLFDRPTTLAKILPKLVRGVAVDAIDAASEPGPVPERPTAGRGPAEERAAGFLAIAADASQRATPALGLGEDVRLTAPGIAGAALVHDGRVVHLGVFAL
jgi:hypothetical protein